MRRWVTLLALGLVAVWTVYSRAGAPNLISYQGVLLDTAGQPVNGTASVQLRIWAHAISTSAGDQLYAEEHANVTVTDGVFSVEIGAGTPLVGSFDATTFAQSDRWLEVLVSGEPLTPRQRFTSVAYALQARRTDDGVPAGAVMHFALTACPAGWSEYAPARGRVLVGLQPGGSLQASVGAALADQQVLTHRHALNAAGSGTVAAGEHNHPWAGMNPTQEYWMVNESQDVGTDVFSAGSTVAWGDGLGNEGSGYYPLAFAGNEGSVQFFFTGDRGSHSHALTGFTASTDSGLPRHQLLTCRKD